jgi:hypothetical protein
MNSRKISAALAGLSLLWSTAFAQSEPVQVPEPPAVIILEIQPIDPPGSEATAAEQAMLGALVMQLLATLEAEGELPQSQPAAPPRVEPGVGI